MRSVYQNDRQGRADDTVQLSLPSTIGIATFLLLGIWILLRRIKSTRVSPQLQTDSTAGSWLIAKQAEVLFEKTHGCGAPHRVQSKWPLGLDLVFEAFRVIGEKQILQWFVGWLDRTGPTFELNALGSKVVYTVEPDNIEAILSTKFIGRRSKKRRLESNYVLPASEL